MAAPSHIAPTTFKHCAVCETPFAKGFNLWRTVRKVGFIWWFPICPECYHSNKPFPEDWEGLSHIKEN